ncbi:MAG TPA: hypothetical protein VGE35_02270 [Candidatus Paceibacterota bacterium]
MAEKKSGIGTTSVVVGLAGLTAAAVGAYYLYGHKNAEKNRSKVKSWMLKAKGEVLEQLENVQDVTETAYLSAVDTVAKKYNELKNIDQEELGAFIEEMKGHWNGIKTTLQASAPKAKKAAKSKAAPKAKKTSRK